MFSNLDSLLCSNLHILPPKSNLLCIYIYINLIVYRLIGSSAQLRTASSALRRVAGMAFLAFAVVLLLAQAVHGDEDSLALKKHVAFFDRNHDGIIHLSETVQGFKALGFGTVKSAASAFLIHVALSSKTRPGESFNPTFPIVIENIKLAKHTSDSDCYDNEGRFVPEKFEEIFAKHAHTNPNALTSKELDEFVKANREPKDYKGWAAAEAEWSQLFEIGKDANNLLPKDTVRKVFDGSLFYEIENKRSGK